MQKQKRGKNFHFRWKCTLKLSFPFGAMWKKPDGKVSGLLLFCRKKFWKGYGIILAVFRLWDPLKSLHYLPLLLKVLRLFFSVFLSILFIWKLSWSEKWKEWQSYSTEFYFFLVFLQKILNLLIRILCTQTVCIIQWFFFGKMSSIKCLNHMKKQLFLRSFLLRQNVAEKAFLL